MQRKIILYALILVVLVGLFGLAGKASAVGECGTTGKTPDGTVCQGTCNSTPDQNDTPQSVINISNISLSGCTSNLNTTANGKGTTGTWTPNNPPGGPAVSIPLPQPKNDIPGTTKKSDFETKIIGDSCFVGSINPLSDGCIKKVFFFLFHDIPAFLLFVSAYFFNILLSVSLSSNLLKSPFVGQAWGVVRDLSNIFFILILLYIAIKIILDLGGAEARKMISRVIIIALLINFSMFFTGVIVDTSNILGLIFYNKITVDTKENGKERPYSGISTEKDVAGGIVNSFDPTRMIGQDFFAQAAKIYGSTNEVPIGTVLAIIFLSGAVMCIALYVFFVSGFFFLGRLIELWILIIFSPFAFVSSTVPQLSGVPDIGWQAWLKRLLAVSFMAPIFMFFLYFIFMLISNKSVFESIIPKSTTTDGVTGMIKMILGVVLPAVLICILLLKAKKYAKSGSGQIGEMVMTGAKMIGGLALGAATGGTAFLASNTAGRLGRNFANNDELKAKAAAGDKGAQRKLALANSFAKSSYDFRQTGVGKFAAKQSGMDFNQGLGAVGLGTENLKGGRKGRDKERTEKLDEKRKTYEMTQATADAQNDRAREYNDDKNEAKKKHDDTTGVTADNKTWQENYDKELAIKKQMPGFTNEENFKHDFEGDNGTMRGSTFDDAGFEKQYKEGGSLKDYGLNKEAKKGSTDAVDIKKVNKDRRKAYAVSLQYPDAKINKDGSVARDKDRNIIRESLKSFKNSFQAGMANMTMTPGGLAVTAAAGVATMGAGLIVAPIIGGFAQVLKDMGYAKLQAKVPLFAEHKDVIAGVNNEKSDKDQIFELLKKVQAGDEKAKKRLDEKLASHSKESPAPAEKMPPPGPTH